MGCIPVTAPALTRQSNHHQVFGDYKHSQQNVIQELLGEQQFNVKLYDFTTKAISYVTHSSETVLSLCLV